jgi:O-acetyl-ADP-ribose deacetylase (regulator of RNase III)
MASELTVKGVRLVVKRGDLTTEKADAVVNPTNTRGTMAGGVALALKEKGGEQMEKDAKASAPIFIGRAIATTAGKLPARIVIHAPTVEKAEPGFKSEAKFVDKATRAALGAAKDAGVRVLAFPGLGCGTGGVPKAEAAQVMVSAVRFFLAEFEGRNPFKEIRFVARGKELEDAFDAALQTLVPKPAEETAAPAQAVPAAPAPESVEEVEAPSEEAGEQA